jgi:hypothetical protein
MKSKAHSKRDREQGTQDKRKRARHTVQEIESKAYSTRDREQGIQYKR